MDENQSNSHKNLTLNEGQDDLSLEEEVLKTLSFLSPMRFEEIILDFDSDYLERNPDFSREELMKILDNLCKEKKVKLIKGAKGEDYQWQRIYPSKSSWWQFWK